MEQLRFNNEQLAFLCRALGQMYHAGIGIGDAFALLAEDEASKTEKNLLLKMSHQADEGLSLSHILRENGCFPAYMCNLILVGEKVGRSEDALNALADYYDGRARLEHQLKNTLLYPCVLLLVLLAVVVILLVWVLPVFNDVYARLGSSLTGLAGGLLSFGILLRKAMPFLCIVLVLIVGFMLVMAALPAKRQKLLDLFLKKQSDKGIVRKINTARFLQALALAMRSGMTDREAVELSANLAEGSNGFRLRCIECLNKLDKGLGLSLALKEAEILSSAQSRLLETGIRAGNGDLIMEQIALKALEESENELESLTARIEPAVVIIMSVLVGAILLSVMLPLMHIMTAIG